MAKTKELDKDSKKRLNKLEEEWDKPGFSYNQLTAFDLHLLLENFQPLQDLIRTIVAAELQTSPTTQSEDAAVSVPMADDSDALKNARNELIQVRSEMAALSKSAHQAQSDLNDCKTHAAKLLREKNSYKQEIKDLKTEYTQLQSQLQQIQTDLADAQSHISAVPELAFLRSDPQLAQAMGLDDLPADDTQALIQTVAVLAQIDNLKRLWEALKDRCEAEKRPASAAENSLLQAALNWHNYNWRSLPYHLINAAPASRYDYETQSRSRHVTKGETVAAMHLPGIVDGSGKTLCKALVQTQ